MKTVLNNVRNEIIGWWKKPIFWRLLIAGGAIFVGIGFYSDLVLYYTGLAAYWFFNDSEATRNMIYLVFGLAGLYFINRRTRAAEREVNISEQNMKAIERNLKVAEQTAESTKQNIKDSRKKIISEQIALAAQQLIDNKLSIRLFGIRSLKRIALSHKEEGEKIMQILSDSIRELAPVDYTKEFKEPHRRADIESAVETLAYLAAPLGEAKAEFCELYQTDLSGLWFVGIDLSYFGLRDTDLRKSSFIGVNLGGTELSGSNISDTVFMRPIGIPAEPRDKPFYWKGHPPETPPKILNPEERKKIQQ